MSRQFQSIEQYGGNPDSFQLLPFRFTRLDGEELLVNEAGEFLFAPSGTTAQLVRRTLPTDGDLYKTLKARHFLCDLQSSALLDVLATKYRTKKSFLDWGATLHLLVLTLRCEHSCHYCQVSRQTVDRTAYDMSPATLRRSLEFVMQAPSQHLTLEFQGGEPLLAFDLLQSAIGQAKELAAKRGKKLTLVLATNLAAATDDSLRYLRDEGVKISTSLDGPAFLHNAQRPRPGNNSHAVTVERINRARDYVGIENVSALMTTTQASLRHPREIVDEYVRLGFQSIFLRAISPYGFAVRSVQRTGYETEEFLRFYETALDYIIALNRQGVRLTEVYAKILLTKILTPFPTSYVDLQSPAGAALSVRVYNYNGDIYASDEGRMLAEINDHAFRLGNVHRDTEATLRESDAFSYIAGASCNEALPGCSECAFQPYCGADPTFHHATQGDAFGHRPTSAFCQRNMGILKLLFRHLRRADRDIMRILWGWVRDRDITSSTVCD